MRMYLSVLTAVVCGLLPLSCGTDSGAAADAGVVDANGVVDGNNDVSDALVALTLSASAPLTPAFNSAVLSYTVDASVVVSELTVTPTAEDANAAIMVNGVAVDSGSPSQLIALDLGVNVITIRVNAVETYTVSINRGNAVLEQLAYAKASNTDISDQFGLSVSLSGDTLAVGAYLEDSNATGIGGNQNDNSAIDSGAVYVFTRTGSTWTQQAYIKASNTDAGDQFGVSVSLSGDNVGGRSHSRGQ